MAIRCASLGSVSHGTLIDGDLLQAFWSELEFQLQSHTDNATVDCPAAFALLGRLQDELWDEDGEVIGERDDATDEQREALAEAVNELLPDALQAFAPPYAYFGAHCGDGSDFGYWPDTDAIAELPRFDDLASVPDDIGEDFAIVNDHGNVSVYSAGGTLLVDYV